MTISLTVNGKACTGQARAGLSLLGFVREELGLTGAKAGCQTGDCGACTVVLAERFGRPGGNVLLDRVVGCGDRMGDGE